MSLSDSELDRYARHIVLREVGGEGQKRLKRARLAVIGAGGIGSAAIPLLAGAGIGRLTIIDDGKVELSNLQRQTLFRESDVGAAKAELVVQFVSGLNANVEARAIVGRIDAASADSLLAGHDLVLDGSDNFATRLAVGDSCVRLGIPLISAAAIQFSGQLGLFRGRPCYRCFVGDAFDAEDCDNCSDLGVLGALTGTVGSFAALMAIRAILGIGKDSAGTLFLFDGASLEWRSMRLPPDPGCSVCGG